MWVWMFHTTIEVGPYGPHKGVCWDGMGLDGMGRRMNEGMDALRVRQASNTENMEGQDKWRRKERLEEKDQEKDKNIPCTKTGRGRGG